VIEQLVGQLVEHVVGIEIEADLGPVPPRVREVRGPATSPTAPETAAKHHGSNLSAESPESLSKGALGVC